MMTVTLDRKDAPRAARRLVAETCRRASAGSECAFAAGLLTSEVVTNAVRHGAGDVTFRVDVGGRLLRVEVGDATTRLPRVTTADDGAEGGRGMTIVDALASDWGVLDAPPGKVVWFELPAQP